MQTAAPSTASTGSGSSKKKKRGAPRHSNSSSSGNKKPTAPLHETARLDNEDYDVGGIHNHSHDEHSSSSGSGESNGLGAGAALADMNDEEAVGQRQQLHAARPIDPTRPLNQQVPVDTVHSRFPYAIIFGPLPLLSWLFPWVGHLGITDSEGMVHDFAGPYFVEVDSFMVTPVRYFQLQPEELLMSYEGDGRDLSLEERRACWDAAVHAGDCDYRKQMHNILCNNCHHHVSRCFAHMGLKISAWRALWLVMSRGRFVSRGAALTLLLPAAFIWTLIIVLAVVL